MTRRLTRRPILALRAATLAAACILPAILIVPQATLAVEAKATGSVSSEAGAPEIDFLAGVESRILDNGLEVVVIPDRRAPVVTHMLWYHAGAADEPRGKSGIAHYLEHLLFKGTPEVPAGVFSKAVASVGGRENAFTTQDATAYFQRVPPATLPTVMAFEADRMVNLELTEAMIATERQVIREERASRIGSSAGAELREAANAALYFNHPYGTPIIGWPDEIDALTAEDAIAFYERFYRPDNATLVIAGDVDPAEVFRLAEETYGMIEVDGPPPERARPSENSTGLTWLAPSYRTAEPGEAEAIDLLADILSGSSTSRLYRRLVVEEGIAAGAGAFFDGGPRDIGRFGLSITPREGVTLEEAEAAIRDELVRVIEEGVTQAELDRARDRLLVSAVFARDSQASMARIIGGALALGSSLEDIRTWPERMAAVSPEDVREAARRFDDEGFVRSILRPKEREDTVRIEPTRPDVTPASAAPEAATEPAAGIADGASEETTE